MADWILTPCNVALESWQWIHQVAAPCNVIRGSGMTCHWIHPNVRHIGILHLVFISTHHRSRHVILYQSAKFYPNRTTLGRKIMTSCRFSRWRISAIMEFRDPIMGSLKSPITITQSTCSWGTSRVLSASSAQHATSALSLTASCQWPTTWRQSVAQHTIICGRLDPHCSLCHVML